MKMTFLYIITNISFNTIHFDQFKSPIVELQINIK